MPVVDNIIYYYVNEYIELLFLVWYLMDNNNNLQTK